MQLKKSGKLGLGMSHLTVLVDYELEILLKYTTSLLGHSRGNKEDVCDI